MNMRMHMSMLRVLTLTMVAVFGFITNMAFAQSGDVVWEFDNVSLLSVKNLSHLNTYQLKLRSKDVSSEQLVSTTIQFFELKYLLKNFEGVETPYELKGKTFKSQEKSGTAAIERLLDYLIHPQNYWGEGSPNDPKVWEFTKVAQVPNHKRAPTDPDALYSYKLNTDWMEYNGTIKYSELKHILAHFDAETPNKLEGKTFNGPDDTFPDMYINHFITVQKQGNKHRPTTNGEIYEQLAIYLSKLDKHPNFSDAGDYYTYRAFIRLFQDESIMENWTEKLRNRISELSDGQVKLSRYPGRPFPERDTNLFGKNEVYFILTKGSDRFLFNINRFALSIEQIRFY